jgi:hypothetical protein
MTLSRRKSYMLVILCTKGYGNVRSWNPMTSAPLDKLTRRVHAPCLNPVELGSSAYFRTQPRLPSSNCRAMLARSLSKL